MEASLVVCRIRIKKIIDSSREAHLHGVQWTRSRVLPYVACISVSSTLLPPSIFLTHLSHCRRSFWTDLPCNWDAWYFHGSISTSWDACCDCQCIQKSLAQSISWNNLRRWIQHSCCINSSFMLIYQQHIVFTLSLYKKITLFMFNFLHLSLLLENSWRSGHVDVFVHRRID